MPLVVLAAAVLLVAAGGSAVVAPTASAQVPDGIEQLEAFDIEVALDRAGAMTVTETITYETGSAPHHGILRKLITAQRYDERYDRVYPFTLLSVSSDTAPDDVAIEHPAADLSAPGASFGDIFGPSARTVLRIGDADVEITGTHTYVVRYRLENVINDTDAGEELYWNITGHEWDFPIAATTVRVHGPDDVTDVRCFAGSLRVDDPCAGAAARDGAAVFSHGALQPNQGMTIAVAFPDGTFDDVAPILDERWTFGRAFAVTPTTVGGAATLALACLLGLATLWRRVARDRQVVGTATDVAFGAGPDRGTAAAEVPVAWGADTSSPVEFVPPEGIRPAQLGILLDEKADGIDVTATIVDLAVREHLRIEQIGEAKRNPKKTKHRLVRLPKDDAGLLGYERTLLTKLFATGPSVDLDDLRNTFATSLQEVQRAVEADAVGRGWFPKSPSKVRQRWTLAGTAALVLAIGLLVGLAIFTHLALLGVPLVVAALALLVSARRMPRRTPAGTGLARRVGGFRELIVESEAHRAVWAEDKGLFTQYLPYAIVFGCTERWAKTFESLGGALPDTSFYVGTQPLVYHELTRSLDGFSTSASATLSSTPGGSGGSGFSGGSSGGGGGGGGGGSW